MFRKLVKSEEISVEGGAYPVRYYESRTARGARRYSSEIILSAADRIIFDADSLASLESKVAALAPATIYSRTVGTKGSSRRRR